VIIADIGAQRDAARIEPLTEEIVARVGEPVLIIVSADLSVDKEPAGGRGPIKSGKRNFECVLESSPLRIDRPGARDIKGIGSHIAERAAEMQVPPVNIEPCHIGANLSAREIEPCLGLASDIAGDLLDALIEKTCVQGECGGCGTVQIELAADAAGPGAASDLIGGRIGGLPMKALDWVKKAVFAALIAETRESMAPPDAKGTSADAGIGIAPAFTIGMLAEQLAFALEMPQARAASATPVSAAALAPLRVRPISKTAVPPETKGNRLVISAPHSA
jgi:hypothetical protein